MSDDEGLSGGRRLPHPLALAWFLLFALILAAVLFVVLMGKARDGNPVAILDLGGKRVASVPPQSRTLAKAPAKTTDNSPASTSETAKQPSDLIGAGPEAGTGQSPVQSSSPSAPPDGTAKKAAEPKLPPRRVPSAVTRPIYAGKALVADPALIERTNEGPLPRIADDGRMPMQAYAPPASAAMGKKKIAIVITGLGISARATAAALKILPPGVTLAFAPYAGDVQRWVSEARKRGHEVLLEVPMEPYDFPDSDPGPHTLRPMLSEAGNIERLKWAMTRFTGYAGVTNLLGGRFLASSAATAPVMTYLERRGLLFYDGGTTSRSAASGIAAQIKAPYVQSNVMIDTIQSGMEIDQKLSALEARARVSGTATGTGFLYPVTLRRVATWAEGLKGRGFVLVPASAIVGAHK